MTDIKTAAVIPPLDQAAQRRRLGGSIERAMQRVIDGGQFIQGAEVAELEQRLADFCGAPAAVACSSGTDALLLILMAQGIGPGDAVFVPAFTFAATAEVVVLASATPVFVDVRADDFTLDPTALEEAVRATAGGPLRPAAVIPVDLFGQPADYDALHPVADRHGLSVIADAAQSFGAEINGARVGTLAAATGISFYPTKPLACYGDGGAVLTTDHDLAAKMRSLRNHGQDQPGRFSQVGINGRLDTLQAAVLVEKLAIFEEEMAARQRIADRYSHGLADVVAAPLVRPGASSVWAQYTIQCPDRVAVVEQLSAQGISVAVHYRHPVSNQPAYRSYPVAPGGLPVSNMLASQVLSLPLHPYLRAEDQDRVIAAVRRAVAAV